MMDARDDIKTNMICMLGIIITIFFLAVPCVFIVAGRVIYSLFKVVKKKTKGV